MKKTVLTLAVVLLAYICMHAEEYYECFITSCGTMDCFVFSEEITSDECVDILEVLEVFNCEQ